MRPSGVMLQGTGGISKYCQLSPRVDNDSNGGTYITDKNPPQMMHIQVISYLPDWDIK